MRRYYLRDSTKAYPRFPVLIFIELGYLSCGNSLVGNREVVILY